MDSSSDPPQNDVIRKRGTMTKKKKGLGTTLLTRDTWRESGPALAAFGWNKTCIGLTVLNP